MLRSLPLPERPEYETLARSFIGLAARIGEPFDPGEVHALLVTIRAFELVDRHVDALACAEARRVAFERVVGVLEGSGDVCEVNLGALLELLAPPPRRRAFVGAMRAFFRHTERLRSTRDPALYLRCVLEEARCAADMTAAVVPSLREPARGRRFVRLAEVANLVDKLHDMRRDHRCGEIAITPNARLHLALGRAFVARAALLAVRAPRPLALVRWGLPFLVPPRVPSRAVAHQRVETAPCRQGIPDRVHVGGARVGPAPRATDLT